MQEKANISKAFTLSPNSSEQAKRGILFSEAFLRKNSKVKQPSKRQGQNRRPGATGLLGGHLPRRSLLHFTPCACSAPWSSPALSYPMDCSPPDSSVHEIFQARILEWEATSFSKGSSRPRDRTPGLLHYRQILYHWAAWEAHFSYPRWIVLTPPSLYTKLFSVIITFLDSSVLK